MSSLAKARASLQKAQGLTKTEQSLEARILAQDKQPPLTVQETAAQQAAAVAEGDWGPVFIYGQMLSQQAWCALIGRMPDMRPCWIRGYERRAINQSSFAALIQKTDEDGTVDPDCLCVGQAVNDLKPWERRLLDNIVDDGFQLIEAVIQPLDDLSINLDCSTYVWRQDKYPDAILTKDWDQDAFHRKYEKEFTALCSDALELYRTTKISDEELKEKALARRRGMTGFEDEEDFKPEEEAEVEENKEDKEDEDDFSPTSP